MISFFIDTHNNLAKTILFKDGEILNKLEVDSNSHSNNIMPMIDELLKTSKVNVRDIDEVIVVNGPGSFTGVRIGVTIAKTLAYTLNIPIKAISSLELLMISSDNDIVLATENDKNGYYIGIFKNKKLDSDMFYLSNSEYVSYIEENHYEDNVVKDIELDYLKIYEYSRNLKSLNPHEVKPLYIKQIEVLNG